MSEVKKIATRDSYGAALVELASVKSRVSTVRKIIIMSILPRLVYLDVRSK